jgi:drug/metabolite transporter (DMT)-like permease
MVTTEQKNRRRKSETVLIIITLIWGGTFVVIKGALDDASPLFFVGVRFLLATAILTPFMLTKLKGFTKPVIQSGMILGTIMFLGFSSQTLGLQYTTASKSAFITGLAVVFTPLLQMGIEKRMPRPANIIGVVLVVIGLYFLTSPAGQSFNVGDGLTLGCAFFFALYIVYIDVFSKKYSIMHLVYLQIVTVMMLSFIFTAGTESIRFNMTGNLLFALAYTAVLATVVNTYLQTEYQRYTTPTRAAIIFTLEPVFAATLAFIVLHEILGLQGVIGGAIIVGGLIVSELSDVFDKWGFTLWYEHEQL